jgi:DNA replication initiation complex subunit (GINS family)
MLNKQEIQKLIDEKLTPEEKEFYKKYIEYMILNNFFELEYFLKHKHLFFRYLHKNH